MSEMQIVHQQFEKGVEIDGKTVSQMEVYLKERVTHMELLKQEMKNELKRL